MYSVSQALVQRKTAHLSFLLCREIYFSPLVYSTLKLLLCTCDFVHISVPITIYRLRYYECLLASIQVLQFGRIDNGCFILDFQAPFSPIQAFATALANLV